MLEYIICKNNEEFLNFQKDNKIKIIQIQPITLDFDIKYQKKNAESNLNIGVFVVFSRIES